MNLVYLILLLCESKLNHFNNILDYLHTYFVLSFFSLIDQFLLKFLIVYTNKKENLNLTIFSKKKALKTMPFRFT